jgi:hypothetical protein
MVLEVLVGVNFNDGNLRVGPQRVPLRHHLLSDGVRHDIGDKAHSHNANRSERMVPKGPCANELGHFNLPFVGSHYRERFLRENHKPLVGFRGF